MTVLRTERPLTLKDRFTEGSLTLKDGVFPNRVQKYYIFLKYARNATKKCKKV